MTLTRLPLCVGIGVAVAANLAIVTLIWLLMARGLNETDWNTYVEAGRRAWAGEPIYEQGFGYRYSPLVAYFFGLIAPIGIVGWRLVSLASLLLLPRRIALVALVTAPLWLDLYGGNILTLTFVLAFLAVSGRPWAVGALLGLCLLVPRPLMAPAALWILWKRPEWRLPIVGMLALHAAALVFLDGGAWLQSFTFDPDIGGTFDFGPARIIGVAWVPIGLALAGWLTWKGRLGYASLAASPYWLPYYPLMLLLELRPRSADVPSSAGPG